MGGEGGDQCWLQLLLKWVPVSAIPAAVIIVFAPATLLVQQSYCYDSLGQTSLFGSHSLRCHFGLVMPLTNLSLLFYFSVHNSISILTVYAAHCHSTVCFFWRSLNQFSCILFYETSTYIFQNSIRVMSSGASGYNFIFYLVKVRKDSSNRYHDII